MYLGTYPLRPWLTTKASVISCLLQGKVVVLEDNFPEDEYPYMVAVHTSARFNAGTTAHVGIKIMGKEANSRVSIDSVIIVISGIFSPKISEKLKITMTVL